LTSRLFIGAIMLKRMRGVGCIVFVGPVGTIERKVFAISEIARVRWILAQNYPWLEAAFVRAYAEALTGVPAPSNWQVHSAQEAISTAQGGIAPPMAVALVRRFIEIVQDQPAAPDQSWADLDANRKKHASWIAQPLLERLLSAEGIEPWDYEAPDEPRDRRTKAVLRKRVPFVALLNRNGQFARLIDRSALIEEVVSRLDD